MGSLQEDLFTYMAARRVVLGMLYANVVDKIEIHFMFKDFFRKSCLL